MIHSLVTPITLMITGQPDLKIHHKGARAQRFFFAGLLSQFFTDFLQTPLY